MIENLKKFRDSGDNVSEAAVATKILSTTEISKCQTSLVVEKQQTVSNLTDRLVDEENIF